MLSRWVAQSAGAKSDGLPYELLRDILPHANVASARPLLGRLPVIAIAPRRVSPVAWPQPDCGFAGKPAFFVFCESMKMFKLQFSGSLPANRLSMGNHHGRTVADQ
jgi:hypothetical protein